MTCFENQQRLSIENASGKFDRNLKRVVFRGEIFLAFYLHNLKIRFLNRTKENFSF